GLAAHIPLAVLAGVLLFVAWNMGEWREFSRLKQFTNHYRLMMVSTFLVTIIFDLTVAVELGLVMACFLFVRRQSDIFRADPLASNQHQLTYRLYGSLFFGAVAKIDPIVNAVEQGPAGLNVMLDATQLISLDTTGLDALEQLHKAVAKRGGHLGMVGVNPQPRSLIERSGFAAHLHTFH
ncbi:MAG: STAS domain-containing protein, partial [Hydrogenophaga sp.]|nr:STAS domain-containing protein [Hydrogenophaga sp.]